MSQPSFCEYILAWQSKDLTVKKNLMPQLQLKSFAMPSSGASCCNAYASLCFWFYLAALSFGIFWENVVTQLQILWAGSKKQRCSCWLRVWNSVAPKKFFGELSSRHHFLRIFEGEDGQRCNFPLQKSSNAGWPVAMIWYWRPGICPYQCWVELLASLEKTSKWPWKLGMLSTRQVAICVL